MAENMEMMRESAGEDESRSAITRSAGKFSFQPKVLVVDDEKRIRDACVRLLNEEGCEVAQAENGETGLKMIGQTHYDIILLDLMMSGISGFEVLSHVKALHPDTVVIVITGYATIEHSIDAMKNGAFDFLPKPFSPKDLRLVISKAIEFISTLQDIAKQKSRMRVMINLISDGVLTTDNRKRVALANPAFLRLMGCFDKEVIGRPVTDIVKESKLIDMVEKALEQPPKTFVELTDEFTIAEKGDEEKIIGARCIPFRDRLDRNLGTVTVLHDITALKKLDKIKSNFVSMVAHEIKSPLNSILMQLKVVLDGLAGDLTEKQREILTRSSERISSLATLSGELLDIAKIESGLINQEKETLDIVKLAAAQTEFHQDRAAAKSLELIFEPTATPARIMGNRTNIEEVVTNLITNAIRYTPEKGTIRVSVTVDKNYACIHVADTGFGISTEDQEKIFQRFYRVKNEKTRFINGTGLGLAIVKSIVDAHHGMIKIDSRIDEGTTFSVCLPKICDE
jgi:two-component system, OmpR family, phosphate regulon sensor histidine kinase PhoR